MLIAVGVLLFHAAALWALQTGLLRRAAEIVVPADILSELMEPPAPKVVPPPPPMPMPATPVKQAVAPAPLSPAPQPLAINDPAPAPNAPVSVTTPPGPPGPPGPPAPTAPIVTSAPPRLELPSSAAEYLQNPKPPYPPISKRMGEQGKVVVRVLIGVDGSAQQAEILQSSGFDRLDQTALNTVLRWRYVPGKRGGVAEAMWFNVPVNFVLE